MKKLLVPALMACALPAFAGETEIGLLLDQQTFPTRAIAAGVDGEVDKANGAGIRVGFGLVDFGPAHFQVNATYHNKAEGDAKFGGVNVGKYSDQYWAAGASFYWRSLVSFGIGAEIRSEKLESGTDSTTYSRPWAKAHLGLAIPSPIVKPFVGLEVAAPLASKSFDPNGSTSDQLKAFAPKLQVGLYGGIRF